MATHLHFHPHPHSHPPHSLRWYAVEHPYMPDWIFVTVVTLTALLLWLWNF